MDVLTNVLALEQALSACITLHLLALCSKRLLGTGWLRL